MKTSFFLLLSIVGLASCKTWSEDDKEVYKKSCMDNAMHWAGSEAKAKTYCDCVLEKMMAKYPNENDALEHMDELSHDTALTNCRNLVR